MVFFIIIRKHMIIKKKDDLNETKFYFALFFYLFDFVLSIFNFEIKRNVVKIYIFFSFFFFMTYGVNSIPWHSFDLSSFNKCVFFCFHFYRVRSQKQGFERIVVVFELCLNCFCCVVLLFISCAMR